MLKHRTMIVLATMVIGVLAVGGPAEEALRDDPALDIGSRLELFVDDYLVERMEGVRLKLHSPRKLPLSGNWPSGNYMTVIKDGDLYRAWYRDNRTDEPPEDAPRNWREITRYAESRDGVHWTQPSLGIHVIGGTRENNVILAGVPPLSHNFSPFLDTRAGVPPEERYKSLSGGYGPAPVGLYPLVSPDGIHWKLKTAHGILPIPPSDELTSAHRVIPASGFGHLGKAFDSQNVSFWSEAEQKYLCYFRFWEFVGPEPRDRSRPFLLDHLRSVARTTSDDFIHWSPYVALSPNVPGENLYTSQTHPYFRAPHIYIALATRFQEPALTERRAATDIVLMTARADDPPYYTRTFKEAFIRPGLDPERWGNRANYTGLNVVPTSPEEMSVYHGKSGHRYVLRMDGFVSVHAGHGQGEMLTRPLVVSGDQLVINLCTSAGGAVRVEVQSEDGRALPGFALDECPPIFGDRIAHVVAWKHGDTLSNLAGMPVRLRFSLQEADLYSLRFVKHPVSEMR